MAEDNRNEGANCGDGKERAETMAGEPDRTALF
jgi:hypothetical protein